MNKVGMIDSGLGGLSVMKEVHSLLPHVDLHYLADSAWCPYGPKSPAVIKERVMTLSDHLISQGADLIVIACNSATITAVETLRAQYPIPFVGMEPAIKPAASLTKTGVIGVLATEASLAGERYHHLLNHHAQHLKVITQPCPDFVTLVEEGVTQGSRVKAAIQLYLEPLIQQNVDVFVLGCTHYPFLRKEIESYLGSQKTVIDTGLAVAKQVQRQIEASPDNTRPTTASIKVETTGSFKQLSLAYDALCPGIHAELAELIA